MFKMEKKELKLMGVGFFFFEVGCVRKMKIGGGGVVFSPNVLLL